MRKLSIYIFILLLFFSCQKQGSPDLRIAVAANMQFAMDSLVTVFEQETGIICEVIVGSSGKLTAQIQAQAPFDIFVSADTLYPNLLFEKKLTTKSPIIYAEGHLIVWTFNEDIVPSLENLTSPQIDKIAIANPKTAPYGKASMELLKKKGILPQIEEKLVFGESISQTNQFIISKAVDIGITSQSSIFNPYLKEKGNWIPISQMKIPQGFVILKKRENQIPKAQQFELFLLSEKGQAILKKFGYHRVNSK